MPKLPALPHVRSSITQGLSANRAYREYQAMAHGNGLQGMRRQDFLRLYSQTRALRGQAKELLDAQRDVPHGGVTPLPRDTIRAQGFGYWVQVHMRSSGESDYMSQPFLIKSNEPLTPYEAERRAGQFLADSDRRYKRIVTGINLVAVERFQAMQP